MIFIRIHQTIFNVKYIKYAELHDTRLFIYLHRGDSDKQIVIYFKSEAQAEENLVRILESMNEKVPAYSECASSSA